MCQHHDQIEEMLRNLDFDDTPDQAHQKHLEDRLLCEWPNHIQPQRFSIAMGILRKGKSVMKHKLTRLAMAAAAMITVVVGLHFFALSPDAARTAWAIEDTITAFQDIKTVYFSGIYRYDDTFECRYISKENEASPTNVRFESDPKVVVIQNNSVHCYFPYNNEILKTDDSPFLKAKIWILVSQMNLWVGDAFFRNLEKYADDWEVSYGKDVNTNTDCAFVTCVLKPSDMYFWFAFDMETKRVVRAKQWWTPDREKEPFMTVDKIVYNEEMSDEIFTFKPHDGAKFIDEKTFNERKDLDRKAKKLYNDDKYAEALELFMEIYNRFPEWQADYDSSLMMMGLCYYELGEYEKAIEVTEKSIREHSRDKIPDYYNLGYFHQKIGQKDKALEAFRKCLELCPKSCELLWNDTQDCIKKLEAELQQ